VVKGIVIRAYVKSLQMVWCVMCVLAGGVSIASLVWTREISLESELETEQGFRYDMDEWE
jgi:hypothetical protein